MPFHGFEGRWLLWKRWCREAWLSVSEEREDELEEADEGSPRARMAIALMRFHFRRASEKARDRVEEGDEGGLSDMVLRG